MRNKTALSAALVSSVDAKSARVGAKKTAPPPKMNRHQRRKAAKLARCPK